LLGRWHAWPVHVGLGIAAFGDALPLTTRHRIAYALAAQGKPADAEAEHRQILDARVRVLGIDHPSTLITVNWLEYLQRDKDK
jgi:hypothetical protein